MMRRKKRLTLFANPHTEQKAKELLRVFGLEERPGLFPYRFLTIPPEPGTAYFPLPVDEESLPGGGGMLFFPTLHSVLTHGFLLNTGGRKILYTSDTAPLPAWKVDSVDVLIHEASGTEKEEGALNSSGHSSSRQAVEAALHLHARELFLCHFPEDKEKVKLIGREARRKIRESGYDLLLRVPVPFRWYPIERVSL